MGLVIFYKKSFLLSSIGRGRRRGSRCRPVRTPVVWTPRMVPFWRQGSCYEVRGRGGERGEEKGGGPHSCKEVKEEPISVSVVI